MKTNTILWILTGVSTITITALVLNAKKTNEKIKSQSASIDDLTAKVTELSNRKALLQP